MKLRAIGIVIICIIGTTAFHCSESPVAGNTSSETTNGYIAGKLETTGGTPAVNARVMLIRNTHDPVQDNPLPDSCIDTTDESGGFIIPATAGTVFNIEAVHPGSGDRALISGIAVARNDTVHLPVRRITKTGTIQIILSSQSTVHGGYVYIPGTTRFAAMRNGVAIIDSVPSGTIPSIAIADSTTEKERVIAVDIVVHEEADVVVTNNSVWNYSRVLYLNTTSSGAGCADDVYNFPVLVRLRNTDFDFSQARNDGGDIRFAKPDGSLLAYEIERWDPLNGAAEIWVRVDTIFGNNATQSIILRWGNPDVTDASNSAMVFDTSDGFLGVWHLGEQDNEHSLDATGNHYDGTSSDTIPATGEGAIGSCRVFNGQSNYIRMNGTAESKLNLGENGRYSFSAWVNADSIDNRSHLIAGKGNEQYYLKFKPSTSDAPMVWEFVEYHDRVGWEITNSLPVVPSVKSWVFVTGVRNGSSQYFYLNGELVDSTISVTPGSTPRFTTEDMTVGRFVSQPADPVEGVSPFQGKIDEVRVSSRTHGSDWVKLCYMNQKEPDALVHW